MKIVLDKNGFEIIPDDKNEVITPMDVFEHLLSATGAHIISCTEENKDIAMEAVSEAYNYLINYVEMTCKPIDKRKKFRIIKGNDIE